MSSIFFAGLLWLIQIHTGYVFETFLSAYLDEMCQKGSYTIKNSSYNDSTSSTCATTADSSNSYLSSIQLIRQKRRAIKKATFEQMQNYCMTPYPILNSNDAESAVIANYISPKNTEILCITKEIKDPPLFKSQFSLSLEFCNELTSSSGGSSLKSLQSIDDYI